MGLLMGLLLLLADCDLIDRISQGCFTACFYTHDFGMLVFMVTKKAIQSAE